MSTFDIFTREGFLEEVRGQTKCHRFGLFMDRNAEPAAVFQTSPCVGEFLKAQHGCWGSSSIFCCCKGFLDKLLWGTPPELQTEAVAAPPVGLRS